MEVPMWRYLAGAAASFLLLTGAFLLWQSRAQGPGLPPAPAARAAGPSFFGSNGELQAPEASAKTREERRFSRADKDDGKVESDEFFAARHRNFDKLDADHNGALSFREYAAKGIEKFQAADRDRTGWLAPAEFAATAPPQAKRKACSCGRAEPVVAENNASDD
jgi:hypothetical protein